MNSVFCPLPSASERKKTMTWKACIRRHMDVLWATDFFTTEVWIMGGLVWRSPCELDDRLPIPVLVVRHPAERVRHRGGVRKLLFGGWGHREGREEVTVFSPSKPDRSPEQSRPQLRRACAKAVWNSARLGR